MQNRRKTPYDHGCGLLGPGTLQAQCRRLFPEGRYPPRLCLLPSPRRDRTTGPNTQCCWNSRSVYAGPERCRGEDLCKTLKFSTFSLLMNLTKMNHTDE